MLLSLGPARLILTVMQILLSWNRGHRDKNYIEYLKSVAVVDKNNLMYYLIVQVSGNRNRINL